MVRIIEIEPPRGDAVEDKIKQRKEVIGKIAVRSNQQNPIKSWDLASNDDFQLELFRFFREKGYFYERRNREWNHRSRELRSVGIRYGASIRWHTQLIASYYWSKPRLGPAAAKNVAELFEGDLYEHIRRTPVELAYQIFLLDSDLWNCQSDLARTRAYIKNLKSYGYFALFSLAVRGLTGAGAKWGDAELTTQLEEQWGDGWYPKRYRLWCKLAKACVDHILATFTKESRRYLKREGERLTYANYFKSQGYITRLLNRPLPGDIRRYARAALRS